MSSLYKARVWIHQPEASSLNDAARHFLAAYSRLARLSVECAESRFSLKPKCHMLWHTVDLMDRQVSATGFAENPIVQACSMDEDFIGRLCLLTRQVNPRVRVFRSMQRYLTQVQLLWIRAQRQG